MIRTAKRRKSQWFGHVSGRPGTSMQTVMTATVDCGRGRGCPRRQWIDDVKRWTGMSTVLCARVAADRSEWRRRRVKQVAFPNGREATGVTDVTGRNG